MGYGGALIVMQFFGVVFDMGGILWILMVYWDVLGLFADVGGFSLNE